MIHTYQNLHGQILSLVGIEVEEDANEQSEDDDELPRLRDETETPEIQEEAKYITYLITWHCKLGNRVLLSDTERDVDRKMEWHFHKKLKAKRDRRLRSKLKDKKVVLDSCKVIVQTAGRARDVPYTIEEPEEDVPEICST